MNIQHFTTIILALGLLLPVVYADAQETCTYLQEEIGLVDSVVPSFVPYKNERANLYTLDEEVIGHVITDNGIVRSMNCSTVNESTYHVYIKDINTIDMILYNESPMNALDDAKQMDAIRIEGQKFTKQVKNVFMGATTKVLSWFGF